MATDPLTFLTELHRNQLALTDRVTALERARPAATTTPEVNPMNLLLGNTSALANFVSPQGLQWINENKLHLMSFAGTETGKQAIQIFLDEFDKFKTNLNKPPQLTA